MKDEEEQGYYSTGEPEVSEDPENPVSTGEGSEDADSASTEPSEAGSKDRP